MHLKKKGTKEHKLTTGILFGVKNNLLIKFMRNDCRLINELIILEIFMNFVERII